MASKWEKDTDSLVPGPYYDALVALRVGYIANASISINSAVLDC
jgi:hypothetical protein